MTDASAISKEPHVTIIHENDEWVEPLRAAFSRHGTRTREWYLGDGMVDLTSPPPPGVFYNRMSASSHTRGNRYAPELTAATLAWLKRHGRTVVNGERALQLEVSKVAQYEALAAFNIETPATIAAVGKRHIEDAAQRVGYPVIVKHNRAGKGLGVHLLRNRNALCEYIHGPEFEESIDGVTLVQQYIEAPEPFITRVEFVGGRLLYAVRVETSDGFELCPADACVVEPEASSCPTSAAAEKFTILPDFQHELVPSWEAFLAANDVGIAGIEFITDGQGRPYSYDVNTNTNYNAAAEAKAGRYGMSAIALYLAGLFHAEEQRPAAA